MKRAADGGATDAQFYCTLNRSSAEVDFLIPALPPGKYAFVYRGAEWCSGTVATVLSCCGRSRVDG